MSKTEIRKHMKKVIDDLYKDDDSFEEDNSKNENDNPSSECNFLEKIKAFFGKSNKNNSVDDLNENKKTDVIGSWENSNNSPFNDVEANNKKNRPSD